MDIAKRDNFHRGFLELRLAQACAESDARVCGAIVQESKRMDAECFSFVLVRPKSPGNIGAAARALKNMGFADLRLVAPSRYDFRTAAARAVHAVDVLERARSFADFGDAVAQHTIVVGTTARTGPYREHAQPLRLAAQELVRRARLERIAVVFGPEDFGLTNDDLKLCHQLITIPTAPGYPSLNLAQAVMLVAYEIRMAAESLAPTAFAEEEACADAEEVAATLGRLSDALVQIGFLPEHSPDHIMFTLRALFGRSGLRSRELDILNGIARQVRWFGEGGYTTLEIKRRMGRPLR
jgi:tRNA/rRNA methyltransferase